jgi:hypothetical protein
MLGFVAVAAVIVGVVVWHHTRARPANAVVTKPPAPVAAVVTTPQATPASIPAPPVAPTKPSSSVAAETAAPMTTPATAPLPPSTPTPVEATPDPASPPQQVATEPASTTATVVSAPESAPPGSEVTATRQMIMAHAPLRVPEVADPDSTTNRQILQTMVTKAISRTEKKP